MFAKLEKLAVRRESLLHEIGRQRHEIAVAYTHCEKAMWLPEAAYQLGVSFRKRPWLVGIIGAAAGILGKNQTFQLPKRAYAVWKGFQWTLGVWRSLRK
jgi:hypothetical protein